MHCRQTQPAPREYHTQYYVVELHRLVELNPNILVWHIERMLSPSLHLVEVVRLAKTPHSPPFLEELYGQGLEHTDNTLN